MTASGASACIACGGSVFSEAPYPREGAVVSSLRFDSIRICATCGLGQALPIHSQADLDGFYARGEYRAHGSVTPDARQRLHERNQCRHRVQIALPFTRGKDPVRVLDVGAGHGWIADWLVSALRGRALSYDYVEPDDAMSALIEARAKSANLRRLREWRDVGAAYDLVFLDHVLEHVTDPLELLVALRGRLAPGAVAYIEVPNADYRFKRNVFPHTFFFTHAALARLADRAGLAVTRCEVFGRPPSGAASLPLRAAYRFAAAGGLQSPAAWLDDRLWHYQPAPDGLWIRWLVSAA